MEQHPEQIIANRLKALRHAKGWTGEKAANEIGVTKSCYQNWEAAIRIPKRDAYPKIAEAFNTTASYIIGFSNQKNDQPSSNEYIAANAPKVSSKNVSLLSDAIAFSAKSLHQRELLESNILLFNVTDQSMAPELNKGDTVLIDLKSTQVTAPDIYALEDDASQIWFRWIRKELGGGYTLYANDKNHSKDQHLDDEAFKALHILGRMTWSGRWRPTE